MMSLKKPEAIDFLKRIMYLEKKMEFIRDIDLETHKIVNVWERMGFPDKHAFHIVNQLSKKRGLLDIADEMDNEMKMDFDRFHTVGPEILSSNQVLMQMHDLSLAGESLLNDFIFFLTLCPHGLGLTEAEIVMSMIPSKLDEFERKDKIELYIRLMMEVVNSRSFDDSSDSDSPNESPLKRQENSGSKVRDQVMRAIKNLLFFEQQDDPFKETYVKISSTEKKAIEFILHGDHHQKEGISDISQADLLKFSLDFILTYLRYLLFRVRDARLCSFSIPSTVMQCLWNAISGDSGENFVYFMTIDNWFKARFLRIKKNIFKLMKQETVEHLVPMLLMSTVHHDTTPGDRLRNTKIVDQLREMSYLTVTLMARIHEPQSAILYTNAARQLFSFEEHSQTHAVLDMLHAASAIRLEDGHMDENSHS